MLPGFLRLSIVLHIDSSIFADGKSEASLVPLIHKAILAQPTSSGCPRSGMIWDDLGSESEDLYQVNSYYITSVSGESPSMTVMTGMIIHQYIILYNYILINL